MGNDQVEGIISPAAAVVPPNHATTFNTLWTDVPPCPSCPQRALVAASVAQRHSSSSGDRAVIVRRLSCDCHCRTCFHPLSPPLSPGTPLTPHQQAGDGAAVSVAPPTAFVEGVTHPATPITMPCASPSPRYGHTLTRLGMEMGRNSNQHFLLFGGTTYLKYFNDLWLLDTTQCRFTRQDDAENVPSPRFGHTCHSVQDQLVMFGGSTNADWFDDVYTIHITGESSPRMSVGSSSAEASCIVPDSLQGQSHRIIFRQWPRENSADPWPCARRSHTFSAYKQRTSVLYGGYCRVSLHDVWFLHLPDLRLEDRRSSCGEEEGALRGGVRWEQLQTVGVDPSIPDARCPESRYCHCSAVCNDTMIVFGGYCASGVAPPVTWRLNLVTGVWESVQTAGQVPRARFGQTSSVIDNRMVVFGGLSNFPHGEALSDCFIFNFVTLEWREVASPLQPPCFADDDCASPKSLSGSSVSEETDRVMTDGGTQSSSSVAVQKIFGRRSHAAAVDPSTNSVVIFGGWNCRNVTDDFCFKLILAPPTLRELVRNFIGVAMAVGASP
jgi:hypothetical protein